ncbi:MAG: universal stress protein [Streptosporangiaceae bacterium]
MTKTIVLAVDTNSHIASAAEVAADLAARAGDRVVVLHVHEFAVGRFGRIQVDCAENEGEHVADEIVQRLRDAGVSATAEIRKTPVGHIARTIMATADETGSWLIILGSTSAHDVPRLPFGSVSLRLLHMSDKPVLIVPRSQAAPAVPEAAAADASR